MDSLRFRFYWLDSDGDVMGAWAQSGQLRAGTLSLGKSEVPVDAVLEARQRGKHLTLAVRGSEGANQLRLGLRSVRAARRLQCALALQVGALELEARRGAHEGRRQQLEDLCESCAHCGIPILLIDQPRTAQVYCRFCDSLTDLDTTMGRSFPATWSVCHECSYYGDARVFSFWSFYFLLVVWGAGSQRREACSRCVTPQAVRTLLLNLPFLLGAPAAAWQLARVTWTRMVGRSAQLHSAAKAAVAGDTLEAVRRYQLLLQEVGAHAGVRRNLAWTLLQAGDLESAELAYLHSLEDCSNYLPALEELAMVREAADELDGAVVSGVAEDEELGDDDLWDEDLEDEHLATAPEQRLEDHSVADPLCARRALDLFTSLLLGCAAIPILGWILALLGYFWGLPLVWLHLAFPPDARASLRNRLAGAAYFLVLAGIEVGAWLTPAWPGADSYPDLGPTASRMLATYINWNLLSGALLLVVLLLWYSATQRDERNTALDEAGEVAGPDTPDAP